MFIVTLELYIIPKHVDVLSMLSEESLTQTNKDNATLLKNSLDCAYEVCGSYTICHLYNIP